MPGLGDQRLDVVGRIEALAAVERLFRLFGQLQPMDLAVCGQGKGVPNPQGGRVHLPRQGRLGEVEQLGLAGVPARQERHPDEDAAHGPAFAARYRDRLRDGGVPGQAAFDFAQLHAVAVEVDLVVLPAQEFDQAVRAVAPAVAGPVDPLSGPRMRDEGLAGALFVVEVAQGHAGAGAAELARRPVRAVLQPVVEDIVPVVVGRPPVGNARPAFGLFLRPIGYVPDRRFGRPADGGESSARCPGAEAARRFHRDPVAAQDHAAQAPQAAPDGLGFRLTSLAVVQQHDHHGRNRVPGGHALLFHQAEPMTGIAASLRVREDQTGTGGEAGIDVEEGKVVMEGGQRQETAFRRHVETRQAVVHDVHQAPERHLHALGLAGRAGGIENAMQVVVGERGGRRQVGALRPRVAIHDQQLLVRLPLGPGEALGQPGGGQDQGRLAVFEHVAQAVPR